MPKKILQIIFFCLNFLFLGSFALAQETIRSFDVQAQIQSNSSVLVQETIVYDFGAGYKHGIYRDIYSKDISVQVKSVVDENGNKYEHSLSKISEHIRVKIGDPNQTITGAHTYIITYSVKGAVKFLADHDEFYWNVTGNNWPAPIEKISATVSISGARPNNLKCYTGVFGSLEQNCVYKIEPQTEESFAAVFNANSFQIGEGLTIVVGWPKGVINPPGIIEKIGLFILKYWVYFIPVFTFLILFIVWWKKGRDIKLDKAIVVQYDLPRELKPLELSYILNQKAKPVDFSASIVDLAVKGFLKIKETEKKNFIGKSKDWIFIKQKDFETDPNLEEFEKKLLRSIFGLGGEVAVSEIKKDFYKDIKDIKDKVSENMVAEDYFVSDPDKEKKSFIGMGVAISAGAYILSYFINNSLGAGDIWLPVVISGFLFFIFGAAMPKKTLKGTETLWHILGFKEYITRAEKYRAQFQEKENIFEKFLPYAIIFGCTKKWAKAFEGIYKTPPTWYEGAVYGAYFSPVNFAKSFDASMASIGTSLANKPGGGSGASGFGGGGFSGGGFGGGGGGSW